MLRIFRSTFNNLQKKTLGPDDEEDDLAEDTFIEFGGADPGGKPIPSIITPDHAMGGKCKHRSFKSESLISFILRPGFSFHFFVLTEKQSN